MQPPGVRRRAVGKWREAFEQGRPSAEDLEYGREYTFGPPATEEQLAAAEEALGVPLPPEVREILREFNGIRKTTQVGRSLGYKPDPVYLDTSALSVQVPEYFGDCDNPLPSPADLRKIVFVAQSNGFGDLWGVCTADVAGHAAGAVVHLDHEVGELEASHPSLADFVLEWFK
jgi:hypothetical protein